MKFDWHYMAAAVLDSFLGAVTPYIPIYFSAQLIDALYAEKPLRVLLLYAALTVGLVFLLKLIRTWASSVMDIVNEFIYREERWRFYSQKSMEMAYESIEDPEINRMRHRVLGESQTGFNCFYSLHLFLEFIGTFTRIIASAALTVSFFAIPSLSVVYKLGMLAGLCSILIASVLCVSGQEKLQQEIMGAAVESNVMDEAYLEYVGDYGSGKDIRLFDMKEFLAEDHYERDEKFWLQNAGKSYQSALLTVPGVLLEKLLQYGVYAALILAAFQGGITVGSIARYVSCIMLMAGALRSLSEQIALCLVNDHYLQRYFSYLDIPNEMYQGTLTVEKRDDNDYQVEFRDVSFRYPHTEEYALRHVNLKFKVGEKLAIVGENGSGKTTFIKLLCRLYDPSEGEILLNGVNITKYDYDEYQSIFSVVFQDFQLFDFKLGEVVASGKQFDSRRVEECLEKANFGERLAGLQTGTDTYLWKGFDVSGVEISGGEAQKIALARALYKDAPFILLDEPTAALDPISEYEVYSNFNAISGDKTAVYISHRLASCRFCDKIAVFDKGHIIQTGSHEELLKDSGGKYHELWNAQARYYT